MIYLRVIQCVYQGESKRANCQFYAFLFIQQLGCGGGGNSAAACNMYCQWVINYQ